MVGSSDAAGQSTMTCGSDSSSALARSRSLRSAAISSCEEVSNRTSRLRVRSSKIAVTTANNKSPASKTMAATS